MIYVLVAIIAFVVALDQVTKVIFVNINKSIIGDFLWFTSTTNDGAAFSSFEGGRWWFIAVSIPVIIILAYILFTGKISKNKLFRVSLAVMIGGIIGNLIDRIIFGYVRDFIYFKFIHFAIFNFADSALTIACIMLVIFILFIYMPEESAKEKAKKMLEKNGKINDNKVVGNVNENKIDSKNDNKE